MLFIIVGSINRNKNTTITTITIVIYFVKNCTFLLLLLLAYFLAFAYTQLGIAIKNKENKPYATLLEKNPTMEISVAA